MGTSGNTNFRGNHKKTSPPFKSERQAIGVNKTYQIIAKKLNDYMLCNSFKGFVEIFAQFICVFFDIS